MKRLPKTLLLVGCVFLLTACKQQTIAPVHSESDFQAFVSSLMAEAQPGQKIAIRPFTAQESPIPLADANRFNTSLEQTIRDQFPGQFRFVPRAALQKIADEADEFGQIDDFSRFISQQQADILIFGQLELIGNQVLLTYRSASPVTGKLLAKTASLKMDYRLPEAPAFSIESALALLADKLASERLSVAELYKGGVFFEESGIQTRLGQYLSNRLHAQVSQRLNRFPNSSAADYLSAEKGDTLSERGFVLRGQYWAFKQHIELRVTLEGSDISRSQGVRIDRKTIPKMFRDVVEPPQLAPSKQDNLGPNTLYLSSDRGRRPVYKIGEQMQLTLQAENDGYLYCFNAYYDGGNAVITRIFPNRYHRNPQILAASTLKIPSDSMDFVFTLHPPAGPEYVYCYLFDRDIQHYLPREMVKNDLVPLTLKDMDGLDIIMRGIPDVKLDQATIPLTVERQFSKF
ncbi:MAG: DUF4384 domain-containing protein [Candidatus Thiodiazotropha taylori]|nr:DUF4384 domain-containing protein [Candidatus Thiodiazotropha taylori]